MASRGIVLWRTDRPLFLKKGMNLGFRTSGNKDDTLTITVEASALIKIMVIKSGDEEPFKKFTYFPKYGIQTFTLVPKCNGRKYTIIFKTNSTKSVSLSAILVCRKFKFYWQ